MRAIDLFAGFGGFSTGARMAGVNVVWAANHWPLAVNVHAWNHPETKHECQDLRQANWAKLPDYDIALLAPTCQGHSEASQPKRKEDPKFHDETRSTAWACVDCLEVTRPAAFVAENVIQFQEWALYDLWWEALRRLGYKMTSQIIRASHCGVPQRRDRLFIVGSLKKEIKLHTLGTEEPAFGPHVDWESGDWRPIRSCTRPNACNRLTLGHKRFGRALVQHTSDHRGISVEGPIRTITTKVQWCAVREDGQYRYLTPREHARAMGFPESYYWDPELPNDEVVKGLGNAVCPPVAKCVIEQVAAAA
jgi:DNA (cytosine-5)-methyltransferase 1